MSVVLVEHAESRKITQTTSGQTCRLRWTASTSLDEEEVRAAVLATAPTSWDDLTLVGIEADPLKNSGLWDCHADYAFSVELAGGVKPFTVPGLDDPLGPEFELDLQAQLAHITQSIRTVTSRLDTTRGGINVQAWAASTDYAVGDGVKNGPEVYTCTQAGTSAGSGGPTGTSTGITDGTCKWDHAGSAADNTVLTWAAGEVYESGDQVNSHGFLYGCTTGGTSDPDGDGPLGTGTGIVDGECRWSYVGADLDPEAPDYGQAIGVTRDRVVGTDIYVGHMEFCLTTQYYPFTLRTVATLLNLIGTFNTDPWYNFPTKTLLYMGPTGTCRPGNIWTLKHRFAVSANLRDVKVGEKITIPFKAGWDFLWAVYRDMTRRTPQGSFSVQVPVAAYVEQVYRAGDFTTLPVG